MSYLCIGYALILLNILMENVYFICLFIAIMFSLFIEVYCLTSAYFSICKLLLCILSDIFTNILTQAHKHTQVGSQRSGVVRLDFKSADSIYSQCIVCIFHA